MAALVVAAVGGWRARRLLRDELDRVPVRERLALLAALLGWAVLVAVLPPHAPWATMTHGLERYADLRDHAWPINLQHLHGPGFFGTVGLVYLGSGGLISPFAANAALSALAGVALFVAARVQSGRPEVAWGAAVAWWFAPVVLRMAPTLALYGPALALLCLALAAWSLWAAHDDDDLWLAAAALSAAAMGCRADFLGFVPVVCGGWLLCWHAPRLLRWSLARALAVGFAALVVGARVAELLDSADPRARGEMPFALPQFVGPWLGLLALGWLLAQAPGPGGRRLWQVVGAPVAVALVLGIAVQLVARGVVPDLPRISPFWHAGYSSPASWAWAALGLVALLVGRPRDLVWLVGVWAFGAALYTVSVDSSSTWVHTSLATWPVYALLIGHGFGALSAQLGPRWRGWVWALLLGSAAHGLWSHRDWVGWVYPRQHEFFWLQRVRAALPAGARVAFLTHVDIPAVQPSLYPQLAQRGAIARFLGGSNQARWNPERGGTERGHLQPWKLQSLQEAMADEDLSAPRYYLRTLDCARALLRLDERTAVYGETEGALRAPVAAELYRPELDVARHALVAAVDGVDAYCAAVERRFELEPVDVVPLPYGHIGHPREQLYGPDPHLGLYRIVGVRAETE